MFLHNVMGRKKTEGGFTRRYGLTCIPIVAYIIIFFVLLCLAITYFTLSTASILFWDNWEPFLALHMFNKYRFLFLWLYITCAIIQLTKIYNFAVHHNDCPHTENHGCRAKFGIFVAFVLLVLSITQSVLLFVYPKQQLDSLIQFIYLIISCCVMMPLLHAMILR